MSLNNLRDVYVAQLKDMYSAEKQLSDALPGIAQAARHPELKQAFWDHLEQTDVHLATVRAVLAELDENPTSTRCKAMEGLIAESSEIASEDGDPDARDAALIVAAQKIEHYEIASYGSLCTFAKTLGHADTAVRLQSILNQEYEADQRLDNLAMGVHSKAGLNVAAKS